MSFANQDENVPVRSYFDPTDLVEDKTYTKDEEDERTLRQIYNILKAGMDGLDQWHAFADGHRGLSELKLKQDIHAHQMAAMIIAPALEAAEQALALVDEKFRQRNRK